MKNQYLFIICLILLTFSSCEKIKIGFLDTENAAYTPDSLVVKTMLDPYTSDSIQINLQKPYQSSPIQGIDGTPVIHYKINTIRDEYGKNVSEDILSQFGIVRKAVIEIAYNHSIPIGEYFIEILVYNEDNSIILPEIFKVVVE